jgi:hypothetical protein
MLSAYEKRNTTWKVYIEFKWHGDFRGILFVPYIGLDSHYLHLLSIYYASDILPVSKDTIVCKSIHNLCHLGAYIQVREKLITSIIM